MKHKISKQKLSLKKQTISNLSNVDLNGVKGGNEESGSGCTYCQYCYEHSICPATICIVPDPEG